MTFTQEQRKNAYKKLPTEIQNLVMSEETTELVTNIIKELKLSGEQTNLVDSEIFFTLLGLQTFSVAMENISRISNKTPNELDSFKLKIESNILSTHKEIFEKLAQTKTESAIPASSVPPASVKATPDKQGSGMAMEIPPNNLPAVEPGETAHDVAPATSGVRSREDEVRNGKQEPPKEKVPLPDYRYPEGRDPYREPLQ